MLKLCLFFILFATASNLSAQTVAPPAYTDANNEYIDYVNNVFGALEANRVPTRLLMD